MKLNKLTVYFAALLLPISYVLVSRGISLPEALFGSVICGLVSLYTFLDKKSGTDQIAEFKEQNEILKNKELELLKSKYEAEHQLAKITLTTEYQNRIQKLEEQITKMNLEKIKRF
jgi:hypothetical protein